MLGNATKAKLVYFNIYLKDALQTASRRDHGCLKSPRGMFTIHMIDELRKVIYSNRIEIALIDYRAGYRGYDYYPHARSDSLNTAFEKNKTGA